MAITIDWATLIIDIPKADTQLVQSSPTEIRSLDLNNFRLTLKDIEDSEDGMTFLHTHTHNPPVTVGGVTLARVIEIINGYTVTFEDGQYAVNLDGANSNVGDVVNLNQVSIRSANSAGLTSSKQVEDTAFTDARVWVDTINGLPGVLYPRGTPSDPVDNLDDAQTIVTSRTLPKRLSLRGELTILATDDISEYDIKGTGTELAQLTVITGANTANLSVTSLSMSGDLNGNISANDAISFGNIIDFDGRMVNSGLGGTIDLGTGGLNTHDFIDCYSEIPGTSTPVLDCNSLSNLDVQFRRYSGGLRVINFIDGNMSIDIVAGNIELDSSCTGGTIVLRGVGTFIDNSNGCNVNADGFIEALNINIFNTDPAVYIDVNVPGSGTALDWGTATRPVNLVTDAIIIAERENVTACKFKGDLILFQNTSDYSFLGLDSEADNSIDFNGQIVQRSFFENCQLKGTMIGKIEALECDIESIIDFEGILRNCGFRNTLHIKDNAKVSADNCFSQIAGTQTPTLDAGANITLSMRHYSGGLKVENFTDGCVGSIDLDSGHVIIDSSSTGGILVVRGVGHLTEQAGHGVTIVKEGLVEGKDTRLSRQIQQNKFVTDPDTGVATLHDDDGSVLVQGQLYEDASGAQTYRGQGAERRERLE